MTIGKRRSRGLTPPGVKCCCALEHCTPLERGAVWPAHLQTSHSTVVPSTTPPRGNRMLQSTTLCSGLSDERDSADTR